MSTIIINNSDYVGKRLDFALVNFFNLSHSLVCKEIRKGNVFVNNSRIKNLSYRILSEDIISLRQKNNLYTVNQNYYKKRIVPQKIIEKIKREHIIYEDENLVCINKPFEMPVQGGFNIHISLEEILKNIYDKIFIVHRLDQDTSGVMIFAKKLEIAQEISELFQQRMIKKKYVAILSAVPEKENDIIKTFIDQTNRININRNTNNTGKNAITNYRIIKKYIFKDQEYCIEDENEFGAKTYFDLARLISAFYQQYNEKIGILTGREKEDFTEAEIDSLGARTCRVPHSLSSIFVKEAVRGK